MKKLILPFLFIISFYCYSQKPEDFGFRHFQYVFENDTIDVLVKSKKGEEQLKKPLFFSVQGSLAVPLIIHDGKHRVSYATLEEGFVEENYHLIIINKPGIPLVAHKDSLVNREYFVDKGNYLYSEKYLKSNHLDYYVERNVRVIDSLFKQDWVDTTKLIISGHSQGSGIAASMCDKTNKATHLIYSSGTPYFSTILAMLHKARMQEGNEANPRVEKIINAWKDVVSNPLNYFNPHRDSNLTLSSFSQNESEILKRLKIPVLISYGTQDESSPYQDLFQLETIRDRITHITFTPYIGLGHNYQLVNPNKDNPNQQTDFLENVVKDWLKWIEKN